MPVTMVRNTLDGPVVMSSDVKGTHSVEWQGSGDPNGDDVQPVPSEILETVQFARAVQRGILAPEDSDDPTIVDILSKQNAAWARRNSATEKAAEASIEHAQNEDLITVPCVGPAGRGDGRCGADVAVKEKDKNVAPPLCNRHENLLNEYVATDGEILTDGKPSRTWARVTLGARERQQA